MANDSTSEEEFLMEDSPRVAKKRKVKMEESDDDPDDYVPLKLMAKKKKAIAKKPAPAAKKRVEKKRKSASSDKKQAEKRVKKEAGTSKPRGLKKLDKTERLQYAMQSFLWWDAQEPPPGCQWRTMEHAGVSFPESYVPHGVKMKYDGQEVDLTPVEEEAATFFAAMDPDGMHLGDPKTAKIFIKNYFEDFRAVLGKKHLIKVAFFCFVVDF